MRINAPSIPQFLNSLISMFMFKEEPFRALQLGVSSKSRPLGRNSLCISGMYDDTLFLLFGYPAYMGGCRSLHLLQAAYELLCLIGG